MLFSFNPYVILVLLFLILWCLLNYKIAFFLSGLALIGLLSDALLSGTGEVYDQVPVSRKDEGSKKLRKRFKMFKSWNPFRRKQEKSKENVSSFHSNANRVYQNEDILNSPKPLAKVLGSTPRLTRQHRSFVVNSSQTHDSSVFNRSVLNASGPLLSTPLLPRVKRAVGANETFSPVLNSSLRSGNRSITRSSTFHYAPNHPTRSTPGTLPAVRLKKTHQRSFLDSNNSFVHSPNTVKIAPPDPSVIMSPRVLPLCENKSENQKPIDTQAVVCALRQRRKRSLIQTDEHIIDDSDQQAKRRRQDSSRSTASSSSLPPMPENLPDLSNANFLMQLGPISMKRPSAPSRDPIDLTDMDREGPAKRARGDNKNNPILSSLSSSKRVLDKSVTAQRESLKRKPLRYRSDSEDSANHSVLSSDLSRSEQVSLETSTQGKEERFTQLHDRAEFNDTQDKNKSLNLPSSSTPTKLAVLDGISKSTRRHQRSLYPGLNTSFQKVPMANVVASVEDYEQDRVLEQQRIHDMLDDVEVAHREKQNKGQVKTSASESLASSVSSSVTAVSSVLSISSPLSSSLSSTTSTATASMSQPISITAATASSSSTSSSTASQPQFSFKPIFGSTTASQVSAVGAALSTTSTPATTSTTQTSGFSIVFPAPDSVSGQSAGRAPPPYSSIAPVTSSLGVSQGLATSALGAALSSPVGGLATNTSQAGLSSASQSFLTSASLPSYVSSTSTQSGLLSSSLMGGLVSASAPTGLLSTSGMGGVSSTSAQTGLLSTSGMGGVSSTYAQTGLLSTSGMGGVSSTYAPTGLLSTSGMGGVSSTYAPTGLLSTSGMGGASSTSAQTGLFSTSAQTGLFSTSVLGGASSTSAHTGGLTAASVVGGIASASAPTSTSQLTGFSTTSTGSGLPSTSVLGSLSSKAGIVGQPTATSLIQPISHASGVPGALQPTASTLGSSGGFSFTAPVDKSVTNAAQTLFAASSPVSSSQTTASLGSSFFAAAATAVTSSRPAAGLESSIFPGATQMNNGNAGQGFNFSSTSESKSAGFSMGSPTSTATSVFGSRDQPVGRSGKEGVKVNLFGETPTTASSSSTSSLFSFSQSVGPGQASAGPSQVSTAPSPMSASPMFAPAFNFGNALNSSTGQPTQTKSAGGFSLPGPSPAQPNQSSLFNFGAAGSSSGSSFGTFGSNAGAVTTVGTGTVPGGAAVFSFGSTNASQSPPKFGFNPATTTATSFVFNSTPTQSQKTETNKQASSVFGMPSQSMAFGSSQQKSAAPVFGGSSTTPTFGSSTVTAFGNTGDKKPGSSGFNFGVGQPAFGAASQTPGFGTSQTAAPVFGASQTSPAFGTAQASAFGAAQAPAPGFGPSPTQGFGPSQTPAPTFGTSAPAGFGSAAGGSATFQFGQSSTQSSTDNKGFNFSASSPPVFNFGSTSANPPNSNYLFNVNTNSGVHPKPRSAVSRTRRKGMKK